MQFPHVSGALGDKRIAIKKPHKSGSTYHNYKGFYTIVLMVLVDADYKFLWIQVDDVGSSSGGHANHYVVRGAWCDNANLLNSTNLRVVTGTPRMPSFSDIPEALLCVTGGISGMAGCQSAPVLI